MKSTIGRKIGLAFLALLILMVAMVGITFRGFNKITSSLDSMEREAVKRGASGNLRFAIAQLLRADNVYIITQNENYQREYNRLSSRVDEFYERLIQLPLTEEELHLVGGIKQDLDSIHSYSAQILAIQHPRQSPKAWALMETMDYRFGNDVNRKTTEIFDGISMRIEQHRLLATANKENASNSIYGITFLGILITLVVSYLTIQRISKPIVTVTKAANSIANGDYSQRPAVKTHDEIAVLAESFCCMAESIQQSQRTLKQSNERYHDLFESTSDLIQAMAPNGHMLYANRAWREALGYTEEELINLNIDSVVHPDNLTQCSETLQRVMSGEKFDAIEIRFVTKDRNTIVVEGSVACRFEAFQPTAVTCFFRDITERKKAEEQTKFHARLLNTVGQAVIATDINGSVIYWNNAAEKIYGWSSAEAMGQNIIDLTPAQQTREQATEIMKQLNEGNSWSGEFLVKRKDGSSFPAFVSDSPIHDQQGKLIGIIGISGDISERKKAEKEISMLADVLKSINECVSITDTENNILFVNDAFVNTYGYTRDELIGQNISIIRPLENPPNALSEILHATSNGGWQSELWNRRKDGSEFFIHLTTTNIKDSNGQVTALIGVATDITDRKRAEEVLRESEEKYKSFFEDDLTGDYITTLDGRLLACNLPFAKMFGYATVDEALKMDVRSLYPDKKAREQLLKRLTREKRLEYNSSELIRKDGKKIYVIENMVGKFNEKGELIEIKGYLFDDTHRRSLETQLIQSQKMESLGTLAGGIAHDFNNILAIILGHINLVRRKFSDNEYITDSADTITTATQRGASLVKQLLTFARKSDVVLESILIHETIKEIRKFIEQTFPKTISIRTDYEKDLPPVVANPTQIHQVLLNLCINARDAMPNGGILSITAKGIKAQDIQGKTSKLHSPEYIYVKVTDTGTGMDEETKNRIFEPFFTTKGRDRGSGLGLATVYGIVESHHGFIDVQSEVGKGTSFNLYFPVQQSYIEHLAKEVSVNDIAGGNETILIADDEESMRKLLTAIFEEKGYHVLAAADGQEALDMYAQQHDDIALVFTDMGLPKISGEEVIAGIQKINADAKIIISSGYFGHNRKSELLKAGVTDFAQKPYFPDEILKKVREVLDLK